MDVLNTYHDIIRCSMICAIMGCSM